eukprot:TRINITY_DN3833_c0_g2_i2.p1 TRINITY_DN3833_c0_g2~~TRINITY_DN3833_c0_g2_i2.p1  ORF type:complete len:295 (-),score=58.57 TRINITY_DN3833_c0_g2_i2:1412-2260(-)
MAALSAELPPWATCVLCNGGLKCPATVGCEHSFCAGCLEQYLGAANARNIKAQCPLCGQDAPRVLRAHGPISARILKYKTACAAGHLKNLFSEDWMTFSENMQEIEQRVADIEAEMFVVKDIIQQQQASLKTALDARLEALQGEEVDTHLEEEFIAFKTVLEAQLEALLNVASMKYSAMSDLRPAIRTSSERVNVAFQQFNNSAIAAEPADEDEDEISSETSQDATVHFKSAAEFIALVKGTVGESKHEEFLRVLFSYKRGELICVDDALAACKYSHFGISV